MTTAFGDLRVGDVMTHEVKVADGSRTVFDFVEHGIPATHASTFPLIGAGGEPIGVVTLSQLRRVPRTM